MTWLDRYIQSRRIAQVRPYLGKNDRVLDVGSADGTMFESLGLTGADCFGIDPTLTERITRHNYTLVPGMFPQDMPDAGLFDAITLLAVIEHFEPRSLPALADGCQRFLRPGGKVVVTVPSPLVDHILFCLRALRLVDGMSLEEHYGYRTENTDKVFGEPRFSMVEHRKFQLGLNNLFVFRLNSRPMTKLG